MKKKSSVKTIRLYTRLHTQFIGHSRWCTFHKKKQCSQQCIVDLLTRDSLYFGICQSWCLIGFSFEQDTYFIWLNHLFVHPWFRLCNLMVLIAPKYNEIHSPVFSFKVYEHWTHSHTRHPNDIKYFRETNERFEHSTQSMRISMNDNRIPRIVCVSIRFLQSIKRKWERTELLFDLCN